MNELAQIILSQTIIVIPVIIILTQAVTRTYSQGNTIPSGYSSDYTSAPQTNYTPPSINPQYIPTPTRSAEAAISETPVSDQLYAETEPNAALKVEPNYMANSRYAIPKGATVRIAKYDEYYHRAEVNGRSGYVCTCQVKRTFTSRQ
jgi:hypothetical protein